MKPWRKTTLGALEQESAGIIQTGPFGSQLHMSDYASKGTPVIMPTNIRDLRVDPTGIAMVSDDHVVRLARHKLIQGDIVYSRRGDVEKCALITEDEAGWLCGTGCLLVRVSSQLTDARFLLYALSSVETRAWIRQHAVGATMLNLNTSILREVPVSIPDIETQRGISAILGALDDKIESNRRIASISSDLVDILAANFLDKVPSQSVSLSKVVDFNQASIKPGATEAIDYIDIAAVVPGRIERTQRLSWDAAPSRARRRVADGDVIFSTVRPGRRSFALIIDPPETAVASTGFAVMTPTPRIGSSLLTSVAASTEFSDYLESVAHGSAYPAVSVKAMGEFEVEVPAALDDAIRFEKVTMPLRRRAAQAEAESHRLEKLRDALLPELLSGRVRVPIEGVTL